MIFKFDNSTKKWEFLEKENLSVFVFSFVDKTIPVIFDNLSFGISLVDENKNVISRSFPENNVVYVQTDQDIVQMFHIEDESFYLGRKQKISVWCENANEKHQDSIEVNVKDFVKQPYPSWMWDEKTARWECPVPYPSDSFSMIWNEETLSWVEDKTPIKPTE